MGDADWRHLGNVFGLTQFGINALADPTLELRDSNGAVILADDNGRGRAICTDARCKACAPKAFET